MNLLDRAKTFIAAKAARIALTIAPLAALTAVAAPAKADAIVFSNTTCNVIFGNGSCSAAEAATAGGDSDANWLQIYSPFVYSTDEIRLSETGTAIGEFSTAQSIPVSWDFQVSNSGISGGTVDWDILFSITTQSGGPYTVDPNGGGIGAGFTEVTGSASLFVPAGVVTGYQIQFTAFDAGSSFSITIPSGSTIDLNPLTPAQTPEPSSLLLALAGAAAAALIRRRKNPAPVAETLPAEI